MQRNPGDDGGGAPMTTLREFSDLHPDLLHLIYSKLPPNNFTRRSGFGSVCKNWRKLHTSAAATCRRTTIGNHIFDIGTRLDRVNMKQVLASGLIPPETRNKLCSSLIVDITSYKQSNITSYKQSSSDQWWLLADYADGKLLGCFNPELSWPYSFIDLPKLTITQHYKPDQYPSPRIFTQFCSYSHADPEWTLFILHGGGKFSTIRRGQWWWRNYSYSTTISGIPRMPAAFGRDPDGGFNVIFDNGNVLAFGNGWFPERMMLIANPPLSLLPEGMNVSGATSFVVRWKKVERRMMLIRLKEGRGKRIDVDAEEERDAIKRIGFAGAVCEIARFGFWCYGFVAFCCPSLFYSVPVCRFSQWVLLFVNYVFPFF